MARANVFAVHLVANHADLLVSNIYEWLVVALKSLRDRCERYIAQQFSQSLLAFPEIVVMTEAGEESGLYPGLIRIQFPGMKIKHRWLSFILVQRRNRVRDYRIGKNAKITAAADWQSVTS